MAAGIFSIGILSVLCGSIGIILLVLGIIGIVIKKKIIFKIVFGIGILFLMVPVGFGSLTAWSAYQSIQDQREEAKEDAIFKKKYPIHWKFYNECKYGNNHKKLKRLAKEYEKNINEKNKEGYTILDELIVDDWYDVQSIKILLEAKAKRSEKSLRENGGSLFLIAGYGISGEDDGGRTEEELYQCSKILIEAGEDVNHREREFQNATPFMAASGFFHQGEERSKPLEKVRKLLKDSGADEKLKDDTGKTAEDYYQMALYP